MSDASKNGHWRLFEYAAILHPTEKETEEESKPSELITKPTTILAPNEQAALIQAARALPESVLDKLDRVEIALRPF